MALTDELISGYHFNELSDTNCADFWGTNGGTASGATINSTTPKLGAANRVFDGINDYVTLGTSPFFEVSAIEISIAKWIYVDPINFNATVKILADSGSANVGLTGNDGFWLAIDDRGGTNPIEGIAFNVRTVSGGSHWARSNNNVISSPGWYFIVATYGNNVGKIYVNNVDETGTPKVNGSGDFIPRNANLCLGATNVNSLNFKGEIDEPLLYDSILSVSEINELWNDEDGLEIGLAAGNINRKLGKGLATLGRGLA